MARNPVDLLKDQRGATAIEYGLIVGLIALAIVGALGATGGGARISYDNIGQVVQDAANQS